jgi:hypothetical protein
MKHEVTLMGYLVDPNSGSIQLDYDWNGYQSSMTYPDAQQMVAQNSEIVQDPSDAVRWMLYYLFALGNTPETLGSQIGKKLIVDIGPAVQQSISMV